MFHQIMCQTQCQVIYFFYKYTDSSDCFFGAFSEKIVGISGDFCGLKALENFFLSKNELLSLASSDIDALWLGIYPEINAPPKQHSVPFIMTFAFSCSLRCLSNKFRTKIYKRPLIHFESCFSTFKTCQEKMIMIWAMTLPFVSWYIMHLLILHLIILAYINQK